MLAKDQFDEGFEIMRSFFRTSCSKTGGNFPENNSDIFTVRRHASAVCAVVVCLSVRPSVRLAVRPSIWHKPTLYQNG